MEIGKRLREALQHRGMSQNKLSEITGFSAVYISNILRGVRGKSLSIDTLNAFAKALDVPMSFLLGETNEIDKDHNPLITPEAKLSYGELLLNLLKAKGLRQTDLSNMLNTDKRVINNYVKNLREPDRETQQRIAKALEVPMSYFYNEISLEEALKTEIPNEKLNKLHNIAKHLDDSGIEELIKAAEKEKNVQEYLALKSKRIS